MSMPPLHQAIIDGDFHRFTALIDEGADINQLDPVMGNAPLHIAAQQASEQWLTTLLTDDAFINLQTPKHGVTPLMVAVWHRKPTNVQVLLEHPEINIDIVSTFGLKAEQLADFGASENDHFGVGQANELKLLFSQYKAKRQSYEDSLTAYQITTNPALKDDEKAKALVMLTDWSTLNFASPVSSSGNDEHTAALVAARDGLFDTLSVLMEEGADQTIPDYYMKAIPLHKAAYNGRANIIRLLSAYPGFDDVLNAQGPNNGYSPLHDAVWHGHYDAAKELLEAGANPHLKGYDGNTPLDLAKAYHYDDIIFLLESHA